MHLLSNVFVFRLLVSQGFCYEWPQIEWLKTKEVQSLTVLEARSLKSRHQQGHTPSETPEGKSPVLPPSFWWWLLILAVPWTAASSLDLCLIFTCPQSLPPHPSFLLRALVIESRAHPDSVWLNFFFTSAKTVSKQDHIHRYQGQGIQKNFFGGNISQCKTMNSNNKNNKYGFIFMKNLIYYFHTPYTPLSIFSNLYTEWQVGMWAQHTIHGWAERYSYFLQPWILFDPLLSLALSLLSLLLLNMQPMTKLIPLQF